MNDDGAGERVLIQPGASDLERRAAVELAMMQTAPARIAARELASGKQKADGIIEAELGGLGIIPAEHDVERAVRSAAALGDVMNDPEDAGVLRHFRDALVRRVHELGASDAVGRVDRAIAKARREYGGNELPSFDDVPLLGDEKAPDDAKGPTEGDPLRGLKHLGPIALFGRQRIHEIAQQPIAYIWQDIAVAGTIVLIAGAPGDGKTTLLFLVLCARLTTGAPVELLGRQVEPAPAGKYVVLIEGEHSEASTARKLVKSLRLLGVSDDALDRIIIVARKAVRLGSPEWGDVCALSAKGLISDIALDTVARVAPADANDEREQVAIFAAVAEAIELAPEGSPKPTVWAVAHTRKNGTTGDLSDVSGSAQRTGQADTVLLVKGTRADGRTISSTVTFAKLREDPDDYPMPVAFAIDGDELKVDGAVRDDRPLPDRVLDLLQHGPLTKSAMARKLGRNDGDIDAALTELFGERAVQTCTVKVGGRERKGFARAGFRACDEACDEHEST